MPNIFTATQSRRSGIGVGVGLLVVTCLALADIVVPGPVAGTLCVGSALAALTARPRWVLAVGGFSALLVLLLRVRDPAFALPTMATDLAAVALVAAVGAVLAERRERAEHSLRQVAQRRAELAAVVDSCEDGIIGIGLDGVVRSWNAGAERLIGYRNVDVVGTRQFKLGSPEVDRWVAETLRQVRDQGPGCSRDVTRTAPDGSLRHLSVVWSPVREGSGRVVGASLVLRDVGDRDREQRSLRSRVAQFERLDVLGEAVGGIAHDFNNLMAVVLSYTAFVEESIRGNPAAQADLLQVRGAAERAVTLTRQLLSFARGEDGVRLEVLDVDEVLRRIRQLLGQTCGPDIGVALLAGRPGSQTMATILADTSRLERLLVNLAANARDAMPDGGTLTICTEVVDLDAGQPGLTPPPRSGRHVLISVADTGTGMAPEVLAHLFEPFFTTKGEQGTGLGLASVWAIVAHAGGSLRVRSERGVGTEFDMYFPLIATPSPSAPIAGASEGTRRLDDQRRAASRSGAAV